MCNWTCLYSTHHQSLKETDKYRVIVVLLLGPGLYSIVSVPKSLAATVCPSASSRKLMSCPGIDAWDKKQHNTTASWWFLVHADVVQTETGPAGNQDRPSPHPRAYWTPHHVCSVHKHRTLAFRIHKRKRSISRWEWITMEHFSL